MGRQAGHHFIPRTYLKGFTEGGKDASQFWCIPINNDNPFITSPKDACHKRDHYTVEHEDPLIIEKFYANEIELKIGIALKYIKERKTLPTGNDMQNVYLLLATLFLRAQKFRSGLDDMAKRMNEVMDSIEDETKISNRSDYDFTKTDWIKTEVRFINKLTECLANKYYRLYIINHSGFDVLTSDQPFILSHPRASNNFHFGLDTPQVEICVPINRKAILFGWNEPCKEGTLPANDTMVGLTNSKLAINSTRFLYSSKPKILLVDDDFNLIKHNISQK